MATRTWIGDTDTDFHTAANWSSNTAPVNGDTIVFDATAQADCHISQASLANAAHYFALVKIDADFDQMLVFSNSNGNLQTASLQVKAAGKIKDEVGGKTSFYTGGTSGVFITYLTAAISAASDGIFMPKNGSNPDTKVRHTFAFGKVSGGTAIKFENGIYPNIDLAGNSGAITLSPVDVTPANASNTLGYTQFSSLNLDASSNVQPSSKTSADFNKQFVIIGSIVAPCEFFDWGNSTLEITPTNTGTEMPFNGNYVTSGNFRYGNTTTKRFKSKFHKLSIRASTGHYFKLPEGAILTCNKLSIQPDARLYGPDTTKNMGAEIHCIDKPTIAGDWNFSQISQGVYRSRNNPPPIQEYHSALTERKGSSGQVLSINSANDFEWSSTAGGGGVDVQNAGSDLAPQAATLNFTGTGVSSANDGSDNTKKIITITDTNTQNTYTSSFQTSGTDVLLRLSAGGAGSGDQDIKIQKGNNITLTRNDANNMTIASSYTDEDVTNANLLTRLNALESSGGASDETINMMADAGDTLNLRGILAVGSSAITLGNGSDSTITVDATAAGTAGKSLTISAGTAATASSNNTDGGDLLLKSGGGDGTGTSKIKFFTKVSGTDATAERMRIHLNGNVGIGHTSPQRSLHIRKNANATDNVFMRLSAGNEGISGFEFGDTDDGDVGKILYQHHSSDDFMRMVVGASEKMRITQAGNIGMGSSFSPNTTLHVKTAGSPILRVEGTEANANPAIEIENDAVHWKLQARGGDSDKFRIGEGTNTHLTIDTSGNVVIGGNLTVSGSTTTISSTTVATGDSMLSLATGQTTEGADAVDVGLYGTYNIDDGGAGSGIQKWAGIFRDASDSGKFVFFKDLQAEPTSTVNTSGTGYALATVKAATFEGAFTGALTGNADTVTNGVYTTGTQTIGGAKTFSNPVTIDNSSGNQLEIKHGANDKARLHVGADRWKFQYADTGGTYRDVITVKEDGTNAGKIGIHTIDPNVDFHVAGDMQADNTIVAGDSVGMNNVLIRKSDGLNLTPKLGAPTHAQRPTPQAKIEGIDFYGGVFRTGFSMAGNALGGTWTSAGSATDDLTLLTVHIGNTGSDLSNADVFQAGKVKLMIIVNAGEATNFSRDILYSMTTEFTALAGGDYNANAGLDYASYNFLGYEESAASANTAGLKSRSKFSIFWTLDSITDASSGNAEVYACLKVRNSTGSSILNTEGNSLQITGDVELLKGMAITG